MEKSTTPWDGEREEDFGGGGRRVGGPDDDDVRSIRTIVSHELGRVEEQAEEMARKEQQQWDEKEMKRRWVDLARPRTP